MLDESPPVKPAGGRVWRLEKNGRLCGVLVKIYNFMTELYH